MAILLQQSILATIPPVGFRVGQVLPAARTAASDGWGRMEVDLLCEPSHIAVELDAKRNRLAISHVSRYYLDSVFSDPHGRLFYDPEHSEHGIGSFYLV